MGTPSHPCPLSHTSLTPLPAEPKGSPNRWKRQFTMTSDARTAILSLAFPPTLTSTSSTTTGLKLAFICTDGTVHIYECREPQDLAHWIAVDVLHVLSTPPPREAEVAFCLSFCPSRWGGEQLVVAAMETVRIYRHSAAGKFYPAEELLGHRALVRDVAWAVSMGRNYHLIATACKDGHVRIFKLTVGAGKSFVTATTVPVAAAAARRRGGGSGSTGGKAGLSQGLGGGGADELVPTDLGVEELGGDERERWNVEKVADFPDHKSEVWKVAWNATGTILSSTGDDGKVRLWKQAINGEFQLFSVVATPRSR